MRKRFTQHRRQGFTLVELMIVIAVLGVIVTLAAPSFYNFILKQRLQAISAQLTTDVQFARSEASARNEMVRVRFGANSSQSCYAIFTGPNTFSCDCLATPVCPAGATNIRTVSVPVSLGVTITPNAGAALPAFRIDPSNGAFIDENIGAIGIPADNMVVNVGIDSARTLRTVLALSGRPSVCTPAGSSMPGAAC